MIELKGYRVISKTDENNNSVVYRAIRLIDTVPVIIKILRDEYPKQRSLNRYKQEYEITYGKNFEHVICSYELVKYNNTLAIIFEDFGGESLKTLYRRSKLTTKEVLSLGCIIADALEELHSAHIIHKDINPSNIVLNPDTWELKIIDFGISTVLSREDPIISIPELIEGTLSYISPEQTGRVNIPIDYRTDYYSFGITLYELLCNMLPFAFNDPLDIVYCHIAKEPKPPHMTNSDIPVLLSDVVMKLLSKSPSDRYQSAHGIKVDLVDCIKLLNGEISSFIIGRHDVPNKLHISNKLYGRDSELSGLMERFDEVSNGGRQMVLVYGYSGIGKTSLIKELYKPVTASRGYFSHGKFDQFQRNIPCSAIIGAFRGLLNQLLSESGEQLGWWRQQFMRALGASGRVIIDVIPEMKLIIGEQPPVQELPPVEAQNRFNEIFTSFIKQFSQREHPLVIFLDDLQWADITTLRLIELIVLDKEINHFILIGAYRDNEVSPTHPLMLSINRLKKSGTTINEINLDPLNSVDIEQLLCDTLHSRNEDVLRLVDIVISKTAGNPFFINQFLKRLYEDGLIKFSYNSDSCKEERFGWSCDISLIEKADITDNVVDFMIHKLRKFPETTQYALSMASCIGNRFDLDTISVIMKTQPIDLYQQLMPAINEELILSTSALEITKEDILSAKPIIMNFKFLHDRVQQAAYSLLDENNIESIHYNIGQRLIRHFSRESLNGNIFTVLDHLNKGRSLITTDLELIELCELNLRASQKARESIAYSASLTYLKYAMERLPDSIWDRNYELAKEIYKERATVEYLNDNDDISERYIYAALEYIRTPEEKAELLHILIVQYTMRARYKEAIQTARDALSYVGIKLPEDTGDLPKARDEQIANVMALMKGKTISSLIDLPPMTRQDKIIAMRLLTSLGPPCYRTHQRLWAVIIPMEVLLCLKYGDVSSATYTYPSFGGLLGYVFNDYKSASEYAELTENLCKKYNNPSDRSVAYLMIGSSLKPWYKHLKYAEEDYNEAYHAGLESGNLQYSGYAFGHNTYCMFYYGKPLNELEEELTKLIKFSKARQNRWAIDLITGVQIIISNLQGKTDSVFQYNELTEDEYLRQCNANGNIQVLCIYYILKMQVLYLYDRSKEALEVSEEVEKRLISVATQSLLPTAQYRFYYSLVIASLYTMASEEEKKIHMEKLLAVKKQMWIWAENCKENFLHMYYLISAEIACITGDDMEAITLYEQSIQSAKENGFIQVEALVNELMAKFWLQKNNTKIARVYMNEAVYEYFTWGAIYKSQRLKIVYPDLFESVETRHTGFIQSLSTYTTTGSVTGYDLVSVMESTQIISSEVDMDKLLTKMMKIIMETAGAQRGVILFLSEGVLFVESSSNLDDIQILHSTPLSVDLDISGEIVHYVANTGKTVIIDNAIEDEQFGADPYIRRKKPRSILSLPVIHVKKVIGVLYLENNLTTGVFSANRITVLNILIPQMAISIENARLFRELEQINRTLKLRVEEEVNNSRQKDYLLINQSKISSLGELLINIAHHWRQPLNAINSLIFDIKDAYNYGELDKEYLYELVDKAGSHIQYMSNVIDTFRDLVKTTSEHETYDIRTCIDEVVSLFYDELQSKDITFKFSCSLHGGVFERALSVLCCGEMGVMSNRNELTQVLLNLINNAVDAIDERRTKGLLIDDGVIDISFYKKNGTICIAVADNGGGIPEGLNDKIYEPYFTTKFKKQGTGLGLYTSKMIVERIMNGKLYAHNVRDGAVFTIEISNK
ncbi:MAG: AAA family ATPase [Nitrospirae bacterium]|nr:AAA family ATPase [Nitrospirota bacterium]